ncbi:MAG: PAS domain-containing protein, partial [Plesiomonas shigelloides]
MRLEVFCEDRVGLTRELLDLLVGRDIDLRGIEIDTGGRIYLSFPEIDFESFRSLMTEIRRIPGITDVRKVRFMPVEREHTELKALVQALPDPVFSVDLRGKIDLVNQAALALFSMSEEQLLEETIQNLLSGFNFHRWLEDEQHAEAVSQRIVVRGQ